MARKLLFTLEMPGAAKIVKELSQIEIELKDIGSELRSTKKDIDLFNNSTEEQQQELIKSGRGLTELKEKYNSLKAEQLGLRDSQKRFNKELREQADSFDYVQKSVKATSLKGLEREYSQLRKELKLLDREARQSAEGLEKIARADKLKKEIDSFGESIGDATSRVGQYKKQIEEMLTVVNSGSNKGIAGALADPLSSIFGGGVGGQTLDGIKGITSALGPYGAAIAAVGSGVAAIGGYVVDVTLEFERLNNQVKNTTELIGQDLQDATVGVKTLAEVFDQDFNEVLQAANALTKEVTGDFNKSIELMKVGFLSGANANGEFLDSIREYSTQIREAGASGEEFIEILIRAQREGIFSDKAPDLIKDFGERIREQTASTSQALTDAFGEKFTKDLFDGINDGSVTTITALTKVSGALKSNQLTAKQTQQVVADVFGGPGEDAGLRFIKILEDIDGDLSDLVDTSDAYTQRQNAIYDATLKLNQAQQDLGAQFAGTGISLEVVTKNLKTFGTTLLDDVLINLRAITQEFQDGNFLQGLQSFTTLSLDFIVPDSIEDSLGIDLGARQETIEKKRQQDLQASKNIEESLKRDAENIREAAKQGQLSIQELRAEQQKLRQEIDSARQNGEDYSQLQSDLAIVTEQTAKATAILNGNIKRTAEGFKQIAADGSIEALSKKVSDLQSQIKKATPNKAKELVDELNAAKLDLSEAQKELDDFKKSFAEANIDLLPTEERLKVLKESIAKECEIRLAAARKTLADSKTLNEQLKALDLSFDIAELEVQKELTPPDTSEYFKVINEINDKTNELENLEIDIKLKDDISIIEEARVIREQIAISSEENEKVVQRKIRVIQLESNQKIIKRKLEQEKLGNEERLELERQYQENAANLQAENAAQAVQYDTTNDEIDQEEQEQLADIIPTFDPENIQSSLDAIKEFEERRTIIQMEANIKRGELTREQLLEQGENVLAIDNELNIQRLELAKKVNADIIKETQRKTDLQIQYERNYAKTAGVFIQGIGNVFADIIDGTIKDAEGAQKAFVRLSLDTLEKIILLMIAQTTAQQIGTKGFIGIGTAAILTGIIKAGFSVAKAAISSEYGNILGLDGTGFDAPRQNLKDGNIFKGKSHKHGGHKFWVNTIFGKQLNEAEGDEAIIKKTSTKKWLGLLSAINEDGGGKRLSPNSEYWKKILKGIEARKYAAGDITGGRIITNNPTPQLINPSTTVIASARIPREDIDAIVSEQVKSLDTKIDAISSQILIGLQETNRLQERLQSAQENSEI